MLPKRISNQVYFNNIEKYKKQIENLKKEKNKYVSFCAKGIITEIKTLEEIIEKQKITGEKENNLKSLQNMEDSDRKNCYDLFKLLIENIELIKRELIKVKIYTK